MTADELIAESDWWASRAAAAVDDEVLAEGYRRVASCLRLWALRLELAI